MLNGIAVYRVVLRMRPDELHMHKPDLVGHSAQVALAAMSANRAGAQGWKVLARRLATNLMLVNV
jgi:hypothetical protein